MLMPREAFDLVRWLMLGDKTGGVQICVDFDGSLYFLSFFDLLRFPFFWSFAYARRG